MKKILSAGKKVLLRDLKLNDFDEFYNVMSKSRAFLHPWVVPPLDISAFQNMIQKNSSDNYKTFTVCSKETGSIAGVINLSNIIRGNFRSGFLGYYIGKEYAAKGYMTEAMRLTLKYIFTVLKLHRVEANIQPGNISSLKLVKRCGFNKEGYSPKYLNINKRWRDHERWAITIERWKEVKIKPNAG